jgi:2-polyprenyl-3-methyl-5-hydroxy-6-metoxy-1,4-benzoquinol methylase
LLDQYYQNIRHDALQLIQGESFDKALEVGCGTGNTLAYLKEKKIASYVCGIEAVADCEEKKSPLIDQFITMDAESSKWQELISPPFQLILLLDVVEHLRQPYAFIEQASKKLEKGGTLLISIPNINNIRIIKNLLFHDRFDYQKSGILDHTHLRFFTKASFLKCMQEQFPQLTLVKVQNNFDDFPAINWLKRLPFFNKFFVCQYLFLFHQE